MSGLGSRSFYPSDQARAYVQDILDSGRVSYGRYSKELESRFAAMHGRRYGVLSNSGTSSLQVAVQALKELNGWPAGSQVIVPAVTFPATVNVVLQNNLQPVLVDVDKSTYTMSPYALADQLNHKPISTAAVVPVHLFGQPAAMSDMLGLVDDVRSLRRKENFPLAVIEDSCEAVLTGQPPGDVACFSFYMAHHVQAGVGGIAITNDHALALKMRSLVNHGLDTGELGPEDEYDPMMLGRLFRFTAVGHSYRMTEFEAALALSQLDDLPAQIARRQERAAYLTGGLAGLESYLQLPTVSPGNTHSWLMYPLVCRGDVRDSLRSYLAERGVGTRLMMPLTNQPCYRGLWNEGDYPVAAWLNSHGFYLGLQPGQDLDELDRVSEVVHAFFEHR